MKGRGGEDSRPFVWAVLFIDIFFPVAVSLCSLEGGVWVREKTDRGAEGVGMGGSMVGLLLPLC